MYSRAFSCIIFACGVIQAYALDFSQSNFIWTNEEANAQTAPAGSRPFRRDVTTPKGIEAVAANVLIIADNAYSLTLNGLPIGSGTAWLNSEDVSIEVAQSYCLALDSRQNVFAINATNIFESTSQPTANNPASLLVAIQILFNDGSTQNIVSDASWLFAIVFPYGWQQMAFDDSTWTQAADQGKYGGPYWAIVDTPPIPSNISLSLTNANFIWTNEVVSPGGAAPVGSRAFRKTITLPPGITAGFVDIAIQADDQYQLYVDGLISGSNNNYLTADRWGIYFDPPISELTIAVVATNTGGPASLLATVVFTLEDTLCGTFASLVTDGTWKYQTTYPSDFVVPSYDDSDWPLAFVQGPYGMSPWGDIPVPPPWDP